MTPLGIDIVLWYYSRAVDYREGDFAAPAVREAINEFRDALNLLEVIPVDGKPRSEHRTYRLTERGRAYVSALIMLPLPVCQWVIPSPATTVAPASDTLLWDPTDV